MKQLGILVPILLVLVAGITSGLAVAAELTADQEVQPSNAAVGETAMVTLMLSYSGNNATQVTVTPGFTPGVAADSGTQPADLSPGSQQMISYPIRAEKSGSYTIISIIDYTDDGVMRQLNKESSFTATGGPSSQPEQPRRTPGQYQPAPAAPASAPVVPASTGNGSIPTGQVPTPSAPGPQLPAPGSQPPLLAPQPPAAENPAPSGNGSV